MNIVYWTTKDNRKINIDEMSIDHLRNIEREEGGSFFEKIRSTKYEDMSWGDLEF